MLCRLPEEVKETEIAPKLHLAREANPFQWDAVNQDPHRLAIGCRPATTDQAIVLADIGPYSSNAKSYRLRSRSANSLVSSRHS